MAKTGAVLTESQLRAMEKAKEEKMAWGEIETEHVGYLGAQDTFYVGTLKGVWGVSISKPSLTRIPRWGLPSFTPAKCPLILQTCSMTG